MKPDARTGAAVRPSERDISRPENAAQRPATFKLGVIKRFKVLGPRLRVRGLADRRSVTASTIHSRLQIGGSASLPICNLPDAAAIFTGSGSGTDLLHTTDAAK